MSVLNWQNVLFSTTWNIAGVWGRMTDRLVLASKDLFSIWIKYVPIAPWWPLTVSNTNVYFCTSDPKLCSTCRDCFITYLTDGACGLRVPSYKFCFGRAQRRCAERLGYKREHFPRFVQYSCNTGKGKSSQWMQITCFLVVLCIEFLYRSPGKIK